MPTNREILLKFKGDKCLYCGASVQDSLREFGTASDFEFNHVDPDRKSPEYDDLMKRVLSAQHFEEIAKCNLLCVRHHRILTNHKLTESITITTNIDGMEPIIDVLKCQAIYSEDKKQKVIFPSPDEWQLAHLIYQVRLGTQPLAIMSGLKLKPMVDSLIERTRTDGDLRVGNAEGETVCTVKRLSDTQFEWGYIANEFPMGTFQINMQAGRKDKMKWFVHSDHLVTSGTQNIFAKLAERATMTIKVVGEYKELIAEQPDGV